MDKLNELSENILSKLIFEEKFENLKEDFRPIKTNILKDEIKTLIVLNLIQPVRDLSTNKKSGIIYSSDEMEEFSFVLTSKGLIYIERFMNKTQL